MTDTARTFALFRVAAGARIGFGHLRRATVLARELDRPCAVSVRGSGQPAAGWTLAPQSPVAALRATRPRLLVLDDPRADRSRPWLRAARRAGIPCASLHDIGMAAVPSDLAVDGSLTPPVALPAARALQGPRFAVLGLARAHRRRRREPARVTTILVSLGGGNQDVVLRAVVQTLRTAMPHVRIVVPGGLHRTSAARALAGAGVQHVAAPDGLAPLLAEADLAIVGGGLTLYEAAALGVPSVGVAVVAAQRPTVRAFTQAGLTVGVTTPGARRVLGVRAARCAVRLAENLAARQQMRERGPAAVDGRGASRVAGALRRLVEQTGA